MRKLSKYHSCQAEYTWHHRSRVHRREPVPVACCDTSARSCVRCRHRLAERLLRHEAVSDRLIRSLQSFRKAPLHPPPSVRTVGLQEPGFGIDTGTARRSIRQDMKDDRLPVWRRGVWHDDTIAELDDAGISVRILGRFRYHDLAARIGMRMTELESHIESFGTVRSGIYRAAGTSRRGSGCRRSSIGPCDAPLPAPEPTPDPVGIYRDRRRVYRLIGRRPCLTLHGNPIRP